MSNTDIIELKKISKEYLDNYSSIYEFTKKIKNIKSKKKNDEKKIIELMNKTGVTKLNSNNELLIELKPPKIIKIPLTYELIENALYDIDFYDKNTKSKVNFSYIKKKIIESQTKSITKILVKEVLSKYITEDKIEKILYTIFDEEKKKILPNIEYLIIQLKKINLSIDLINKIEETIKHQLLETKTCNSLKIKSLKKLLSEATNL